MACINDRDDDLRDVLERHLGRVCTIFPVAGGRAGDGFTGVLSEVDGETCTLLSLDSFRQNGRGGCGRRGCDREEDFVRREQIIPLDRIACVSTSRR